jgi:hypothetical protein
MKVPSARARAVTASGTPIIGFMVVPAALTAP